MLNKSQIDEILKIIKEHFGAAIYKLVGSPPSYVDIQKLRKKGIIDASVPDSALKDSYLFGILAAMDEKTAKAPFSAIKIVANGLPLSPVENDTIDWLNDSAALYCQGLGNKFEANTLRLIHDASKEETMRGIIQTGLSEAATKRKTRSEIITQLRQATQDMQRDWHRIVNTELHGARTQGIAQGITKQFGDDAHVIVRPHPDCCDLCRAAYLKGGKPKVFKLSDLAGRNNVGRTQAELRAAPGLPSLHVFCACEVNYFNPNMHKINDEGQVEFKKFK